MAAAQVAVVGQPGRTVAEQADGAVHAQDDADGGQRDAGVGGVGGQDGIQGGVAHQRQGGAEAEGQQHPGRAHE